MGACKARFIVAKRSYPKISISSEEGRGIERESKRERENVTKIKEKSARGSEILQSAPERLLYVIDLLCDALVLRTPR